MAGYTIPFAPSQIYTPNGRLVDLIRAQGEDAARAAELRGQQQAQLWQGIGNTIQTGVGQAIQGYQQANNPAVLKQRQDLADTAALNKAYAPPTGLQPGDTGPKDNTPPTQDQILASLQSSGNGHLVPVVKAQFDQDAIRTGQVQAAQEALATANASKLSGLALAVRQHDYDPAALTLALQSAASTYKTDPAMMGQIQRIGSAIGQNPSKPAIQQIVDSIPLTKTDQETLTNQVKTTQKGMSDAALATLDHLKSPDATPLSGRDVLTGKLASGISDGTIAPGPGQAALMTAASVDPSHLPQILSQFVTPEDKANWDAKNAATAKDLAEAHKDLTPAIEPAQSKSVLLDNKPAELMFDPKAKKWTDADGTEIVNAAARIKPIPPASMTINPALVPSGDALDMAAKRYLATGELPSMGMGQAGAAARVAVMNAAAKIDPVASLAANKASYKADSTNLTNLQKTEGTLSAFENTAGKNLDQFMTLANKIPDTGVPWLNTPVRLLDQSVVGSQNMAAITAARDVALREIARVTNDPKLSGALTDSARQEIAGLSPTNATLPQIKAVVNVLKQDMANVHSGLNQQIDTVKQGLGGNPAAPPPVITRIRVKGPNGESGTIPQGGTLPAGWTKE